VENRCYITPIRKSARRAPAGSEFALRSHGLQGRVDRRIVEYIRSCETSDRVREPIRTETVERIRNKITAAALAAAAERRQCRPMLKTD
jgi:hypothetical protein